MSDQQVRDEVLTILLVGHETTAVALIWTWYLLAVHLSVQARLETELDEALGELPPTVADLPDLVYSRAVLAESLPLYPPIYMLGRMALEPHPVGEYTIPAGASVVISPYIVHRDARFYRQPGAFEPLRWISQPKNKRPRNAYLPFGGGSRGCIGEPFARQEGILALATLAQRWQMRLVSEYTPALEPRLTLRPKGGLPMQVNARRARSNRLEG
jgi:cytochrome P450